MCSICLGDQEELVKSEDADEDDVKWSSKLSLCVPELETEWNRNCLLCAACTRHLRAVFEFRKLCLRSHELWLEKRRSELKHESDDDCNGGGVCASIDLDYDYEVTETKCETSGLTKKEREDATCDAMDETDGWCKSKDDLCGSVLDKKFKTSKLRDIKHNSVQCNVCGDVLDGRNSLVLHVEEHHASAVGDGGSSAKFICFHCNRGFMDKRLLAGHMLLCKGKTKRCHICDCCFSDRLLLENHLMREHDIGEVKSAKTTERCNGSEREEIESIALSNRSKICHADEAKEELLSLFELEKTLCDAGATQALTVVRNGVESKSNRGGVRPKMKRGRKPKEKQINRCETCKVVFTTKYLLNRHVRNVHATEKLHNCDTCGQKFASPVYLSAHKRYHSRERPHICSFCGKGYITASDLYHHEKIHANKRAYKCEKCPKAFNTSSDLHKHKICVHVDRNEWKYVCTFCDRRFPLKTNLDTHTKTHTGERNFACHLCDRRCINRSVLLRHIESHSNVRSFRCNVCSQDYKYQKSLDIHRTKAHGIGDAKIPERVKKYFCHACPKSYFANNKLQKHIRTHTGERPFACEMCDKRFIDKSYVKQHLKTAHNVTGIAAVQQ